MRLRLRACRLRVPEITGEGHAEMTRMAGGYPDGNHENALAISYLVQRRLTSGFRGLFQGI